MRDANANVFFVGLMGAGKTTVGRAVARRLERPFFDSDHEIEARTGARIPVIFELEGEAGFRDREAQVIEELTAREGIVLATAGGAVLRPENRAALKARGFVVYLRAHPHDLWLRTRRDKNRSRLLPFRPFVKLLLAALGRLPHCTRVVHCGVRENLADHFGTPGEDRIWWQFTRYSCHATTSVC